MIVYVTLLRKGDAMSNCAQSFKKYVTLLRIIIKRLEVALQKQDKVFRVIR